MAPSSVPFSKTLSKGYCEHFYRAILRNRGTSHGPVSVCLSVRPYARHKSEFY